MSDTSKEVEKTLQALSDWVRGAQNTTHPSDVKGSWIANLLIEYEKAHKELTSERDALRKAVDGYAYIGRDGKVTLAKDLENERDQLRTQLHTAHNAGLDAAINCINEFMSSERIGSHEYVKGQTECMLHLRDKISSMKSGNGDKK